MVRLKAPAPLVFQVVSDFHGCYLLVGAAFTERLRFLGFGVVFVDREHDVLGRRSIREGALADVYGSNASAVVDCLSALEDMCPLRTTRVVEADSELIHRFIPCSLSGRVEGPLP